MLVMEVPLFCHTVRDYFWFDLDCDFFFFFSYKAILSSYSLVKWFCSDDCMFISDCFLNTINCLSLLVLVVF